MIIKVSDRMYRNVKKRIEFGVETEVDDVIACGVPIADDLIHREQAKEEVRKRFHDLESRTEINAILNSIPNAFDNKDYVISYIENETDDDRRACAEAHKDDIENDFRG